MKLSPELLTKAKKAKTEADLIAFAKENGVTLTAEEAKSYYAQLHQQGALADDELDNVAGGCSSYERPPRVEIGRAEDGAAVCPKCMGGLSYGYNQRDDAGDYFDPVSCYHCQLNFRHYWIGDEWTEA